MIKRTGSPDNNWFLAIIYVFYTLNHAISPLLHWRIPLEQLTGITPDITSLLRFQWYEPVYYKQNNTHFPSNTREKEGRFVGIAENIGYDMTYKILLATVKLSLGGTRTAGKSKQIVSVATASLRQ